MNLYYGSDGTNMGTVSCLPITSFQQFVKELLGHPVLVNVTKDQFLALGKADRNAMKRVSYFVPAAFGTSPVSRTTVNATKCHLIALDIDDENPTMGRVYVNTPAALSEALKPYAHAAYVTASSTMEKPRLRVVVAADSVPVDRYAEAVRCIAKMLGLVCITAESLVPVQPMYFPTSFAGDDLLGDHPLIASEFEGQHFTAEDIKNPGAMKPAAGAKIKEGDASVEDLDFLSTVVQEITLETMESALGSLDPDMPYMEWLGIASALRHQFPFQPEEAYDLFDRWSQKGKKYVGEKDTVAKWESLRATPKGRKPITARSIIFRAAHNGWEGCTAVASRFHASILSWMNDRARTPTELLNGAVRRIAGAPLLSPLERATLLSHLQIRFKESGLKVTTKDIQQEMKRFTKVAFSDEETVKSTPDAQLPVWARGVCYVAGTNEFFARSGDRKYSPPAMNNMYNAHLMPPGASDSGKPPVQAQDYLLNVVRIPRVDHYIYDPSHPEQTFFSENGARFVNTYRPTYPEPKYVDCDKVGKLVEEHVHQLVGEVRYEAILIDWMAYMVQFPGAKIRWAPLIQGAQGCGKTFIAKLMEVVLGQGNIRFIDANLLFESFNGWATGSQLVCIEEVRVVGHNRHEVMNKLKPAIGNDDVTVRELYTKPYPVKNRTNYMLLTNYQDALALTPGDRRYFVLHSRMQTREQVLVLGDKYFSELFSLLSDKACELRAWLLNRKISPDFDPNGHAPRTKYLYEMVEAAENPAATAIKEFMYERSHPLITENLVSIKTLRDIVEGSGVDASGQYIGTVLREEGFRSSGRVRLMDGKHCIWVRRGSAADGQPGIELQRILEKHPELNASNSTVSLEVSKTH